MPGPGLPRGAPASRAIPLRLIALVCLVPFLAGCASLADQGMLVQTDAEAPEAYTRTLLAVTTRQRADDRPGLLYSGERGGDVRYVSLTMSMPPNRQAGTVPTGTGRPDPAKDIALVSSHELTPAEFATQLDRYTVRGAPKPRALVFVHGFNTRFDEAVVRFAQIVDDTGFSGVPVLFSWPSRGSVRDYGYDKDSANFSRDAMGALLTRLAHDPDIAGVDIFAHSMGNWLTMEVLRDLAIAKDTTTLARIDTVVLAAPDVDMDVFRTQVARLGPLAQRMTVYASKDDYALQISRRLFGGKMRAGENTDLAQFRVLGVSAVDMSSVAGGVGKNHGKAFGDGATIATIGRTLGDEPAGRGESGLAAVGSSARELGAALLPSSTSD